MQLSQEGVIVVGAVISLVVSFIVALVVHDRDAQKIKKCDPENETDEAFYEFKGTRFSRKLREHENATSKRAEAGLPELYTDFVAPSQSELWVRSIEFGLQMGFIIFLIFLFFSCSVQGS
jgi:hypothetical protein